MNMVQLQFLEAAESTVLHVLISFLEIFTMSSGILLLVMMR